MYRTTSVLSTNPDNNDDVYGDTIEVHNHGLTTGDTVVYSGTSHFGVFNDREYGVIVPQSGDPAADDPNNLALGATFDGASIDPLTDTIIFAAPHNFVTGDKVVYIKGEGGTTVSGLAENSSYWVLVLDGKRIKLTTYDPTGPSPLRAFTPDSDNSIDITGHGFSEDLAVTYHAPQTEKAFSSLQVDVSGAVNGEGIATLVNSGSANNIQFVNTIEDNSNEGHPVSTGFSNGTIVRYSNSASVTTAVTFGNNGDNDTISRSDGLSWLDQGYAPGRQITVTGAGNNNATYTIAASGVSATTLILTTNGTVIQEGPETKSINLAGAEIGGLRSGQNYKVADVDNGTGSGGGTLTLHAFASNISVNFLNDGGGGNNDRIQRLDAVNWFDEGFRGGQTITVTGAGGNNATYTISSISGTMLTLSVDNVVTEAGNPYTKSFESSTIALSPDKSAAGAGVTHSLIRPSDLPMTYLDSGNQVSMDGRTFYVHLDGIDDANTFELTATPGGPVLDLTAAAGAGGNHFIGPESVDLGAASGKEILRIDLTGDLVGATLLGPGGVPLNIISPPIGDGTSSAAANGSGGGLISVKVNDATINDNPTVKSYVNAGQLRAGGDVEIETWSTTNATASASNASGGLVGWSDSDSHSNQTNTSDAYVDTDTRIIAGGDFTLSANSFSQSSVATSSITGGFVGVANAHANTTIDYATKATVKANADVLAGDTISIKADVKEKQTANAKSSGLGFGGDGDATASITTNSGLSQVQLESASSLDARAVLLSATTSQLFADASGRGYGAGFVAISNGDASVNLDTANKVLLDANASVTGYEGVDFIVKYSGVNTSADNAFSRSTGLFGHVDADATNNTHLDSQIVGAASARVTAGPRKPSDPVLADGGSYDHLAFYVDTTNGSIDVSADADVSRRSLAGGGAAEHGGPADNGEDPWIDANTIAFSSDVVILSGLSPVLVVDSDGKIVTADNISVNSGNDVVNTDAYVGDTISVDPITNSDPGQVLFSTGGPGAGTISGSGGTWEFRDTFSKVRITNYSKKNLKVNGIDVVNTTVDPVVDLLKTNSRTLTFEIERTVAPTFVEIRNLNLDPPSVLINGVIENPIGTTRIVDVNGDILSAGSRLNDNDPSALIRTNILDLEANNGNIGTTGARINVDIVDSANVPAATDFISARVSDSGDSIYLGQNQFFTGELVRYNSGGADLDGLVSGQYYYVIESADGLSIQLASVGDPGTPLNIAPAPTGNPTDTHSLTPAQRFTVLAEGDANLGKGNAYLDVKARLRDTAAHVRPGVSGVDYGVIIDAVSTTGDANLKLWGSVRETDVSGTTYPNGATSGHTGVVLVKYEGTQDYFFTNFDGDSTGPGPGLDKGVFANEGASADHIDSTYDIRALDTNGHLYRPGITAERNIIINAAEPFAGGGKIVNVLGITEIIGGGDANPGDQHHIDVLTNGDITLSEKTDDLRVGQIRSTAGNVTLNSPAAIIDALDDGRLATADVTARNITMTAGNNLIGDTNDQSGRGGIGTPGNFLEINVDANGSTLGVLNATDTASAIDAVQLHVTAVQPGGLGHLRRVPYRDRGRHEDRHGPQQGRRRAGDQGGIAGRCARRRARETTRPTSSATRSTCTPSGGSIGSQSGAGAEYNQAQLNGNNDLEIDSQRYVAGTIGARASNNVYLTETDEDARVVLIQGMTGNARFTVRESSAQGEDLISRFGQGAVPRGCAGDARARPVNTPQGSIMLRVGDNVNTDPNAQILAGHNVNIFGDFHRFNGFERSARRPTAATPTTARSCACKA